MSFLQDEPSIHRSLTSRLLHRSRCILVAGIKLISCRGSVGGVPPYCLSPNVDPPSRPSQSSAGSNRHQHRIPIFQPESQDPPRLPSPYSPSLIIEPNSVSELLELLPSPPPPAMQIPQSELLRQSKVTDALTSDGNINGESRCGQSEAADSERNDGGWVSCDPGSELITGGVSLSLNTDHVREEGGKAG